MPEGKMSKSLGNVIYLKTLIEQGYNPLEYRYMSLNTHYRMPLTFSEESLQSAKASLSRLKNIISEIKNDKQTNKKALENFKDALSDDLNTPKALAVLWELLRDTKAKGKINTIKEMDKVLGLDLLKKEKKEVPKEIEELAKERNKARKDKDWKEADKLRDLLNKKGWNIKDSEDNFILEKI